LEPEVAGGIGKGTVMDRSCYPPVVSKLNYEFDVWLGDVLLEGFPCWIVTVDAQEQIALAGLTGVTFGHVEISTSPLFREIYPTLTLPKFSWLKIVGTAGHDDFGIPMTSGTSQNAPDPQKFKLVVSERALKLLQNLGIRHADVSQFPNDTGC
jgi:hypothetical protein